MARAAYHAAKQVIEEERLICLSKADTAWLLEMLDNPREPDRRGRVRFDTPVLGNSSWPASAPGPIPAGTRVRIVRISGQLIEVEPLEKEQHHGNA